MINIYYTKDDVSYPYFVINLVTERVIFTQDLKDVNMDKLLAAHDCVLHFQDSGTIVTYDYQDYYYSLLIRSEANTNEEFWSLHPEFLL